MTWTWDSADVRFDRQVERTEGGCWLWRGYTRKGYGYFNVDKRSTRAHRYAYERFVGPIAAGLVVMHTCDVPNCVNPAHLRLGTVADNMHDMDAKGRRARVPSVTRTMCRRGLHELSGANLWVRIVRGKVQRQCLACRRAAATAYSKRKWAERGSRTTAA